MSKRRQTKSGDDEEMEEPAAATTPKPRRKSRGTQFATPLKQKEITDRTITEAMKTPKVVKQKQRMRDSNAVYLSAFGIRVPAQNRKQVGKRKSEEVDTDSPCTRRMISMLSTVSLNTPPPLKRARKNLVQERHDQPTAMEEEDDDDNFLTCENWDDYDDEEGSLSDEAGGADEVDSELFREFQSRQGKGGLAVSTPSPVKKSPRRAFLMGQSTPESGKIRAGSGGCFLSPISSSASTATPVAGRQNGKMRGKYSKEVREKYNDYLLEMSFSSSDGDCLGIDEWYESVYKK